MSEVRTQGTTGPAPVPQGVSPAAASRVVPLEVGQRVQATVVALGAEGRIVIGLLGGQVQARTDLPLEVGRTYDLVVRSVHPEIRLASPAPGGQDASSSGSAAALGPGNAELTRRLAALLGELRRSGPRAGPAEFVEAFTRLQRGEPSGVDLRTVAGALGRDEVTRWLAPAPRRATPGLARGRPAAASRAVRGVEADRRPAGAAGPAGDPAEASRPAAREEMVGAALEALASVERENARRVRLRAPLWVPLPLAKDLAHEGRMFLLEGGEPEDGPRPPESSAPVRVVLLLDLVRLGWVRADVEVLDDQVNVAFAVVEERTLPVLDDGLDELRSALGAAGLRPGTLGARLVSGPSLPVADVLAPAGPGRRGLVDVHV